MTKIIKCVIILLLLLCAELSLEAQIMNIEKLDGKSKNFFNYSVGLDNGFENSFIYGRVITIDSSNMLLSAKLDMPSGKIILDDFNFDINAMMNLVSYDKIRMPMKASINFTLENNKLMSQSSYGIGLSISPGYYGNNWYLAANIDYRASLLNNVRVKNFYKENYYADAKDGWYKNNTSTFRFGLNTGVNINCSEINLSIAYISSINAESNTVPISLMLGYNCNF